MERFDDGVLRILRPMFALGLFDRPPVIQPLPEAEHGAEARAMAERAMVLLKNENALPFGDDITSIAVIGADADTVVAGGGSSLVIPTYMVSPLQAIRERAGAGVDVQHVAGADPVTSTSLLPGPDPVPSGFLTPPDGQGQGLRAEYFLNPDFSGEPAVDRVEPYAGIAGGFYLFQGFNSQSPHFPLQPQTVNTTSSFRWTGQLTAPVAGMYELSVTTTGTSRVFIDGQQVITTEQGGPRDMLIETATLSFESNSTHDVRIEFANLAAAGAVDIGPMFKFGWTPPPGVVSPQAQAAADLARRSQVAVVVVRDYSTEGGDVDADRYQPVSGAVPILVGASSADIRLEGTATLAAAE